MKQRFLVGLASVLLATGCSSQQGPAGHHADGSARAGGSDYCAEYRATMAGKSVEEQRKAAEAHIVQMHGSADAAHVERHIKMMEQRCGSLTQDKPKS